MRIRDQKIRNACRWIRNGVERQLFARSGVYCVVCCRWSAQFAAFGDDAIRPAQCIHCGSLERSRLLWLYLQRHTDILKEHSYTLLHMAPEICLEPRLRAIFAERYTTADLNSERVSIRMDITEIPCADESFDVILCNHVLEHVPDDRAAMRELHRVLKTGGWAVINAPITVARTDEDPTIVTPEERLRRFGQSDHVRRYGPDYADRLADAGFMVEVLDATTIAGKQNAERLGIGKYAGDVYVCRK